MPKFRSITISIISGWEFRMHPEFPHPMSQKFKLSSSQAPNGEARAVKYDDDDDTEEIQEYSYLPEKRETPQVSVYIPSCPGTRFWVRYTVSPDHPPCKFFYFKLYMNGRHITSWGMNPKERPTGQVMRGLFNPTARNSMEDAPPGIQSRRFYFAPEAGSETIGNATVDGTALDGGLIEVRCFRAFGRRKRSVRPEEFRDGQKRYGLELPTSGLLDAPQDAKFFNWVLRDPKDDPYACFRFHYRTWDNLEALSLIPSQSARSLISRSVSLQSLSGSVSLQSLSKQPVGNTNVDRSSHRDIVRKQKHHESHKHSASHDHPTLRSDAAVHHRVVQGSDEKTTNDPSSYLAEVFRRRRPSPGGTPTSQSTKHAILEDHTTKNSSPIMVTENRSRRPLPVPGAQLAMKNATLDVAASNGFNIGEKAVPRRPLPIPPRAMIKKTSRKQKASESFPAGSGLIESPSKPRVRAGQLNPPGILDDFFPTIPDLNHLKSPPHFKLPDFKLKRSKTPALADRPPTPFATLRPDESSHDPFPRLPSTPSRLSQAILRRASSTLSTAQSITPSLSSYVDRETNSESPEPVIGVAAMVPMVSSPLYYDDSANDEGLSGFTVESPPHSSLGGSPNHNIAPPSAATFSPAYLAALRQDKNSPDHVPATKLPMAHFHDDRTFKQRMNSARAAAAAEPTADESTVGLAGDDWCLRTPSPARRRYEGTHHARSRWSIDASEDSGIDAGEPADRGREPERSRVRASLPAGMAKLRAGAMQKLGRRGPGH